MFDECECGMNCPPCENCGEPECQCKCYKEKDETEDQEW